MDTALKLEALLEHADWVRRLAHSLVKDPARADDIAQETWLAALEAPPRDSRNLRAWLGSVARNVARRNARTRVRRDAHEASAAKSEALPSAAELVEQADLQREIAGLVISLDEPYRQTLLLRYYQGLSAEEIGLRTDVPLNTVRTRLQRGLAQLREKLDRRFGDRGAWCIALAPMLRAPLATSAVVQGSILTSMGALIMAVKMKWIVAASVALFGLWWLWPSDELVPPSREVAKAHEPSTQPLEVPAPAAAPLEETRVALDVVDEAAPAKEAPPRITTVIRGRCVDLYGVPMAGLELEWKDHREARVSGNLLVVGNDDVELTPELRSKIESGFGANAVPEILRTARGLREAVRGEKYERPSVLTNSDGTFRIEQDSPGGMILPARTDLRILGKTRVAEFPETLHVIAPCVELAGVIVDEAQRPIPKSRVGWKMRVESLRTFPFVTANSDGHSEVSKSADELGRFRIEGVPVVLGGSLLVSASGFAAKAVPIPEQSDLQLVVALVREEAVPERHIAGRVVHRDGRPAQARVDFGNHDADLTDEKGEFFIALTSAPSEEIALTAISKDARPASLPRFGEQVLASKSVVDDVVIVLDAALPPIRGRVIDAAGNPCARWGVALLDGAPWGMSNRTLESMAAGEEMNRETDEQGRFQFGGLLDHPYRIRAWSTKSLVGIDSEPAFPGTEDLVLRVPEDALVDRVVGRVVSRRGLPIAGAAITLGRNTTLVGEAISMISFSPTSSDGQGRFELVNVPREGCRIGASDPRIRGSSVAFDASMIGKEILIETELDLRFRVEPARAAEFDRFQLHDRAGTALDIVMHMATAESHILSVKVGATGSPICSTTESAETLVLYLGETEVRRIPLSLRPGEITVITP